MTVHVPASMDIQHDVALSPLTTIKLGGKAQYVTSCSSVDDMRDALRFASKKSLRVQVLGGGSNIIFPDSGFSGLVLRVDCKGISFTEEKDTILVAVASGEEWDPFVEQCIGKGLAGIECLSGIPGLVGATPIQNVGAYGQEVRETIVSVKAIDRRTLELVEFSNSDCRFGYRQSRFKSTDADRFIVTDVTFRLRKQGRPEIRYQELQALVAASGDLQTLPAGEPVLRAVREAVLTLRKRKSMVVDLADPNSRSVGSFFMNPVLSRDEFDEVESRWKGSGRDKAIPTFASGANVKIPAAWLVENAGFPKGYRVGGVGISQHHSLALVNYNGTTRELLDLATRIVNSVRGTFGITLEREPVVVPE